uniref:Uncharacterized protein n=1 Tax=Aureoumbra lagunensis TaxID=44058 RepID=A0A7S3K2E6_9STRA|mmetsp:Transcript_8064/g.10259  ORF Transcript_8064/g.10259 Transcript_8064/m.10259 type:complete len:595 (-) Transcript_8064:434-2218(-)
MKWLIFKRVSTVAPEKEVSSDLMREQRDVENMDIIAHDQVKKLPSRLWHKLRMLGCLLGPIFLIISLSMFKNNIDLANRLGLQRMRTQRTLKRALVNNNARNCSLDWHILDPFRSLTVIRKKHRHLKKESDSKSLKRRLAIIGDEIDIFEENLFDFEKDHDSIFPCEKWTIMNSQAGIIVRKYTESINTFDVEQSVIYYFVVIFNTLCWIILAYLVHKHEEYFLSVQASKTKAIEEKATSDRLRADMQSRHFLHEIMNHRFGNRIREARLLFEAKAYEEMERILQCWEYETDIRMGQLQNLPRDGISAKDLFAQVFTFYHSIECFCDDTTPLHFYDSNNEQVSYPILQVAFLQDIASNILRHGGAFARIILYKDRIEIINSIINRSGTRASNHIGLNALLDQSQSFHIPFTFHKNESEFKNILTVRLEPVIGDSQSNEESTTQDNFDYTTFSWFLVEDSRTIAELTAKQYRKLGVDLVPLAGASDVFALEGILVEASKKSGKPLVVIFDENIFTLSSNLDIIPETGTNVRRRLLQNSVCAALHAKKMLFFASCSASEIRNDSTLICKLGKSTPPRRQLVRLRETLSIALAEQQH